MFFKPRKLGSHSLSDEELKTDKKNCRKIGPCGIGRKALYLNSFYISRYYYVCWNDVRRVFKRVAMSKGGYSGKGIFGSMPYLVVQFSDGTEKQCNFKFEDQVDQILEIVQKEHPGIPVHSKKSEEKLERARRLQEAKYLKVLSPEAEKTVWKLRTAKETLERSNYPKQLSYAAKQKRIQDNISPSWRATAIIFMAAAVVLVLYGIYAFVTDRGFALVALLAGLAVIAVIMAVQVLPTGTRNKKAAEKDWNQAIHDMERYLSRSSVNGEKFPVPPQYAHPVVLERMIRIVREGRAETADEALAVLKEDLKKMNKSVRVSQEEYDEVVAIKPMFLVCDYQ